MVDFQSLSTLVLAGMFFAAAVAVWFAGSRVALYVDSLADRFHLGQAFAGMILLALATELPEIATLLTAASIGNQELALSSHLGSVIANAAILAALDMALLRSALTFFAPRAELALQSQLVIILAGLTIAFGLVGEVFTIANVGILTFILLLIYLAGTFLTSQYEKSDDRWQALQVPSEEEQEVERQGNEKVVEKRDRVKEETSTPKLILFFLGGALVILAAGYFLGSTADVLAERTGLGSSFFGVTLLALATSLPEVSTTSTAIRLGNYSMAVSNMIGSNAVKFPQLFFADIAYREGSILDGVPTQVLFILAMGIVMTALYLVGMTERRNKVILGFGVDSLAVIVLYLITLVALFFMR